MLFGDGKADDRCHLCFADVALRCRDKVMYSAPIEVLQWSSDHSLDYSYPWRLRLTDISPLALKSQGEVMVLASSVRPWDQETA